MATFAAGPPATGAEAPSAASAAAAPRARSFSDEQPLNCLDTEGQPHTLGQSRGSRGVALVVLGSQCPTSREYIPELHRLAKEFSTAGVEFYGLLSEPGTSRAQARQFAEQFRLAFPLLVDAALLVARRLEPSHTPEAFVFHPDGTLVYRGRIDDRFAEPGRPPRVAATHELELAVQALLSGGGPPPSAAPVGCRFEALTAMPTAEHPPTYHRHIAPLLAQHCGGCHRPGEVAPFSLLTFSDAADRHRQLVEVATRRIMPPWKAELGYGHFVGQRRLSDDELALLKLWSEAGAPQGDAADGLAADSLSGATPAAPESSEPRPWRLGEPDLVLAMPAPFPIPADGTNLFRWFALVVPPDQERMVTAFEFRAGNPQVVHHAVMFLDTTGAAIKLDARSPEPGYESFGGPGFLPTGYLGSWSPGVAPCQLPGGTGVSLRRGTVIALQMHYAPTGKPEQDCSQLGLYFADDPRGLASVTTIPVFNRDLEIPAGTSDYRAAAEFTLPVPVRVIGLAPHMHYVGRQMQIAATLPESGQVVPLLRINDWNFNWQDQYQLRDPLPLPQGARLRVDAHYDNTSANPANPHSPPQTIRYGAQSTDEMCLAGIQVALEKPSDFTVIAAALIRQFMEGRRGKPFVNPFE